jgi:hypothetical protein
LAITCGIDWAETHHDVALVDGAGKLVAKRRISDDAGVGDGADDPRPAGAALIDELVREGCPADACRGAGDVDVAAYSTPPMRAVTAGAASAAGARSRSAAVASTSATLMRIGTRPSSSTASRGSYHRRDERVRRSATW